MYKDKFDELVNKNVISQAEKEKIYFQMKPNLDGQFTGLSDGKIDYKYYVGGDIFNDNLCNFVANHCIPPLGMEYIDDTFKIYGVTCSDICDRWEWFRKDKITQYAIDNGHKPIEDASDEELWKMLAMSSMYWEGNYQEWFDKSKDESRILDQFIGKWESEYFGYDDEGYTKNTIYRILKAIDIILKEKFKQIEK